MTQRSRPRSYAGILAGAAAASSAAYLLRRAEARRETLAERIDEVTGCAICALGVPAESRYLPLNDIWLHAVVAGPEDGPLIVLLHGFPECWHSWSKHIKPLAEAGYRVVVPDQRGYNLSDKPPDVSSYRLDTLASDIRELIRAMGKERATIVGHDWGGWVAWVFAMQYRDVVDKLIVMNAPHPAIFARELRDNPDQRRRSWYMFFFQMPWLPEVLLGLSPARSAQFFFRNTAVRKTAFSDADLEVMACALAQPDAPKTMIHWYRAGFRYRPAQRHQVIEAPTLVVWGEDDLALGKSLTYGLEKWAPNARVHYIPNCGHWVQNEAADEVRAQMLEFLRQTAAT